MFLSRCKFDPTKGPKKIQIPFFSKAKAYMEGYKMMGKNAAKTKLPTEKQWQTFEKAVHDKAREKRNDARLKYERETRSFKQNMRNNFEKEDNNAVPGVLQPFDPIDRFTIMGAGASLGCALGISIPASAFMFSCLGSRMAYRKLAYTAVNHPEDMFGKWPGWPAKYEAQRVKWIQKLIIELATESNKVIYHHGYLDSPEAFYGETDFRKPFTEDQKESAKQGIGQLPPSGYFEEAMQILWADDRVIEMFGHG